MGGSIEDPFFLISALLPASSVTSLLTAQIYSPRWVHVGLHALSGRRRDYSSLISPWYSVFSKRLLNPLMIQSFIWSHSVFHSPLNAFLCSLRTHLNEIQKELILCSHYLFQFIFIRHSLFASWVYHCLRSTVLFEENLLSWRALIHHRWYSHLLNP